MNYTVYNMNKLNAEHSPKKIDGFIFFSSLEDRSWNIIDYMNKNNSIPRQVLIIKSLKDEDSFKRNCENYDEIRFTVSTISEFSYCNMIECLKEIHEYLNDKDTIGIDISVMPIPVFSQILHLIVEKHSTIKIIVYYTEPKHYNLDNIFDYSGNDGEVNINIIPGFEGETARPTSQKRMILYILGFEMNYLNKLIPQDTNPDGIIPINGFPSYYPKYKDISLVNNNVNYHENDIQVIFSEANNPFEAYNRISYLAKKYKEYCIDIIPTGSKPMALGACLYALKNGHNNIRMLYPFPEKYKKHQSLGIGTVWEYIL